ncbi:UTP--glucose-1-phosphate uridylyltransferase AglF [uncultured archaeon]|nr:UTP--glucose-1-phosphate uridylyltransferase AglF [uncultured archaeon]
MVKKMKAVIPAAGLGTRFLPATKSQPKEMLPLVDKPAIHYVVEEAVASGIDDIIIVTGRGKRAIEDYFDHSVELEMALEKSGKTKLREEMEAISEMASIHFIRQKHPLGLGHAVLTAEKHVGDEPFAVLLGDDIIYGEKPATLQLIERHRKYEGAPVIAVEEVPRSMISSYGIIKGKKQPDGAYIIEDLVEKPKPEDAPSNLGITGRYVFTPDIFDALKKTKQGFGGEIQLTDGMNILRKKRKMYAFTYAGIRYDLGSKLDYLRATVEFGLRNQEIGEKFRAYLKNVKP